MKEQNRGFCRMEGEWRTDWQDAIVRANRAAYAAGLSYGEYVAKQRERAQRLAQMKARAKQAAEQRRGGLA